MYSFTINQKPYKIPSSASELTLGQFIEISQLRVDDELALLNILMGEPLQVETKTEKEIEQVGRELKSVYKLIDLLREDLARCIQSGIFLVAPKRITILGLDIEIKENFMRSMPYWGYIHTRAAIIDRLQYGKDENFNATQAIPGIIAHNLYTLVTRSKYNEEKAEQFIEVVMTANFIESMQLGNFFLLQQKKLWTSKRKRWGMNIRIWRLRLVWKLLTSMGRQTRSKPLAGEIY